MGLLVGALLVATLMTVWFCRPEPMLIDISRAVGSIDSEEQTWNWLSDDELIVVTTDTKPGNPLGAVDAELYNVVTGKRTQLPELATLLNRYRVSPAGLPFDFKMSPSRTFLVWDNYKSGDHWPYPAAAHLDGSHYREWSSDTRSDGFFFDDRHWVEYYVSNPSAAEILGPQDKSTVHVLDLEARGKIGMTCDCAPGKSSSCPPRCSAPPFCVGKFLG